MRKSATILSILIMLSESGVLKGQQLSKIHTIDITNFWTAYDRLINLTDTIAQQQILQTFFIDSASDGMRDFIKLRPKLNASKYVESINKYPKFWRSIRAKTMEIDLHKQAIQDNMDRYKRLYPNFKQPEIFLSIAHLNTGGTTSTGRILIGSEMAAADSTVDASELTPFLQNVFKNNLNVVYIVTHEATHTQQVGLEADDNGTMDLLGHCIEEGACEFIAELIVKKELMFPYMTYGRLHERELWDKFKGEMYGKEIDAWLYNRGTAPGGIQDLGYFMGYEICKSYYNKEKNKQLAIRKIIELNYSDNREVHVFFLKSGYAAKWLRPQF
jgi:hypothetical protein